MEYPYNRIVSLVPSLTELVINFGLAKQVVGRTRFCIHPEEAVENIPIIGGTKNPGLDKIIELNPELIIANKEENREQHIQQLRRQTEAKVRVTEIATINQALLAIHQLGVNLGVETKATALSKKISNMLEVRPEVKPLRTAYFIWKDPWMTVGGDTYIHDVMQHWQLENVYGHRTRYPKLALDELSQRNPELVLLSSEPYPFKEKHIAMVQEACPNARVMLVEGEWFSWYGSRMLQAFEQLNVWRTSVAESVE